MKKLSKILFLFSLLFFISCNKEGTIGPKGDTGDTGPAGPKGDTGTANVIYSGWMDADWNVTDNATFKQMVIAIDETKITYSDFSNKSLVLMYLKQFGTSSIYSMPGSGRWSNTNYSFMFGSNAVCCRGILVELSSTDGAALTDIQYAAVKGNKFRYIIIKGSIPTGKIRDPRTMSYEEICHSYHIPQ